MRALNRFIAGLFAGAFALSSFAATLTPVQLLNPAGSTAGQVIASTGATTPPAWATVTLSGVTGTLAVANGGTGNTSAAAEVTRLGAATTAGTLAQFASTTSAQLASVIADETGSGPIVFGTSPTISQPNIVGVTTNSVAATGSVGESPFVQVATNTAISIATLTNLCTLPLAAGDWEVSGNSYYTSGTTTTQLLTSINTVSATSAAQPFLMQQAFPSALQSNQIWTQSPMTRQVTLAASANVYLVGYVNGTGAPTYQCSLRARRPR